MHTGSFTSNVLPQKTVPMSVTMQAAIPLTILGTTVFMLATSGCATLHDGRTAEVTLNSTPAQAKVTVRDLEGVTVAETTTPGRVELKRGKRFMRRARYEATFEKPGYATDTVALDSKLNPWALGNIALGGGLGVVVDAWTGALWKPKQSKIERPLIAESAAPYITEGRAELASYVEHEPEGSGATVYVSDAPTDPR